MCWGRKRRRGQVCVQQGPSATTEAAGAVLVEPLPLLLRAATPGGGRELLYPGLRSNTRPTRAAPYCLPRPLVAESDSRARRNGVPFVSYIENHHKTCRHNTVRAM